MLSYCGLSCEDCEAYVATKNNNQKLKEKVAKKWSKLYGKTIKAGDISCYGCKSNGPKGLYCEKMCKINKCCIEKNFETCAQCDSFACKDLQEVFNYSLEAKKRLDCLRHQTTTQESK